MENYIGLHKIHISFDEGYCRKRSRYGRDRMVVGFTATYAISAYNHCGCEFESRS